MRGWQTLMLNRPVSNFLLHREHVVVGSNPAFGLRRNSSMVERVNSGSSFRDVAQLVSGAILIRLRSLAHFQVRLPLYSVTHWLGVYHKYTPLVSKYFPTCKPHNQSVVFPHYSPHRTVKLMNNESLVEGSITMDCKSIRKAPLVQIQHGSF